MEAAAATFSSSPKTHFSSSLTPRHVSIYTNIPRNPPLRKPYFLSSPPPPSLTTTPPRAVAEALHQATDTRHSRAASPVGPRQHSRIDNSGRFCSPRAARELAMMIAYAACLEGSDPVQLFDKRVNAKRVPGYSFDKTLLLNYNHMSFGEAPIEVETEEKAEELMRQDEKDSALDAAVLSAPLKLVYSNFALRFARDILEAVSSGWNQRVHIINKVIPHSWKNEATSRIIELCILHIAMAEITSMRTKHQIVINEAVDLAKRFCDGRAPRIINGCLRTFVKHRPDKDSTAEPNADESKEEEITESETTQQT